MSKDVEYEHCGKCWSDSGFCMTATCSCHQPTPMTFKEEKLKEFNSLPEWWDLPKEVRHGEVGDKLSSFLSQALDEQKARILEDIQRELQYIEDNRAEPYADNTHGYINGLRHVEDFVWKL